MDEIKLRRGDAGAAASHWPFGGLGHPFGDRVAVRSGILNTEKREGHLDEWFQPKNKGECQIFCV
jgi:hypothetical protein